MSILQQETEARQRALHEEHEEKDFTKRYGEILRVPSCALRDTSCNKTLVDALRKALHEEHEEKDFTKRYGEILRVPSCALRDTSCNKNSG